MSEAPTYEEILQTANGIVLQQFARPDLACRFDDPLIADSLPCEVYNTVLLGFFHSTIDLLTITWGGGSTATFRRLDPDKDPDFLLPASQVLTPVRPPIPPAAKESYMDYLKSSLDQHPDT